MHCNMYKYQLKYIPSTSTGLLKPSFSFSHLLVKCFPSILSTGNSGNVRSFKILDIEVRTKRERNI